MENVSHNTSFDSAEDDLSRATNQQPFEDVQEEDQETENLEANDED